MKRRHSWFVQVSYSDMTMDVVGSDNYVQSRALFDQFVLVQKDEPEGVICVEMIDTLGRLVASTNGVTLGDTTPVIPPGHHVWSESLEAYVPAQNQLA
jgi:hypothetical protein